MHFFKIYVTVQKFAMLLNIKPKANTYKKCGPRNIYTNIDMVIIHWERINYKMFILGKKKGKCHIDYINNNSMCQISTISLHSAQQCSSLNNRTDWIHCGTWHFKETNESKQMRKMKMRKKVWKMWLRWSVCYILLTCIRKIDLDN